MECLYCSKAALTDTQLCSDCFWNLSSCKYCEQTPEGFYYSEWEDFSDLDTPDEQTVVLLQEEINRARQFEIDFAYHMLTHTKELYLRGNL